MKRKPQDWQQNGRHLERSENGLDIIGALEFITGLIVVTLAALALVVILL